MFSVIPRKLGTALFLFALVLSSLSLRQDYETPQRIERLRKQIDEVISGIEGEAGVAVKHLETGEELAVNGDVYFPMWPSPFSERIQRTLPRMWKRSSLKSPGMSTIIFTSRQSFPKAEDKNKGRL